MSPARGQGRLRRQLMLAFAGFALLVAALYGFYVVLFAYLVEDRFFQGLLQQEAARQVAHHEAHGDWLPPQLPFVSLHTGPDTLPDGLAARLAGESWRREFPGNDDRHYHLERVEEAGQGIWLAAEVSRQLVVRPMRGGIAQWLGWSSLGVLALALSIGAWIAHRLTAPLSRLAALMETASPERMPREFSAGFPDNEVGTLARGLEHLIRRVDDFVAREQEFTRDASHELGTPLAVIRSACERLGAREDLDAASRTQLDHLRHSAQQLEQTVTILLALAREASHAEAASDVAVLAQVERVIVDQAMSLDAREAEVRVDIPAGLRARLPAAVFRIVLTNLIGNAFAHVRGGAIDIHVADGWLRIVNTAVDMPADAAQPFVKGADSAGYGLGLAIVRRLCDRHAIATRFETQGGQLIASLELRQSRDASDGDASG